MKGMSVIVKTIARWVKVLIFLFSIYITLTGHLTPGGGFAGGVIIVFLYILLTLAYGREFSLKILPKRTAFTFWTLGILMFITIGLLGIVFNDMFFINFLHKLFPGKEFTVLSSGNIILYNFAICITVISGLFLIFITFASIRIVEEKGNKRKYIQKEEEE